MEASTKRQYIRDGIFSTGEVLRCIVPPSTVNNLRYMLVEQEKDKRFIKIATRLAVVRYFNGHPVRMNSARYRLFERKGVTCVACGLIGIYFALEKDLHANTRLYHFNLYGIDDDGDEVMMTKDHITPRAKGGPNTLDNYQPMCRPCNNKKGDKEM